MPVTTAPPKPETTFGFPDIQPTNKPCPFNPVQTPVLENYPLDSYPTLKDWVEDIALAQWQWIEDEIVAFFRADWQPYKRPAADTETAHRYPSDAEIPYQTGWYHFTNGDWSSCTPDDIPAFIVADTESCRLTADGEYRPFLFGGLTIDGWFMWHCNDEILPLIVPFPPDRIIVGHNFGGYDSQFLSCENSSALGRRTHTLDTLGMVTRYRGLSNQQTAKYKGLHSRVSEGATASEWYHHATEGALDHAVERLLSIKIDKGVRDAMVENLWGNLYDVASPESVFEYWAQDVYYTALLFKKLFPIMRDKFLPSAASWVGMLEMGSCRVWVKDWDNFLSESEGKWEESKTALAKVVKFAADKVLEDPAAPAIYRQYEEELELQVLDNDEGVRDTGNNLVSIAHVHGSYYVRIFDTNELCTFGQMFAPDAQGVYSFGGGPDEERPVKAEKALHKVLKAAFKDLSTVPLEQGDILNKLSTATGIKFTPTCHQFFDWTPMRSGANKGQPQWHKKLSNPSGKTSRPFSIGTKLAPYLLGICWEGQPIWFRKVGNKGTWVIGEDREGAYTPLPHPKGNENLGTPFCSDYIHHVTSGTLTSTVLTQEELTEIYRHLLLAGQWTQFRGRYHAIQTHPSEHGDSVRFIKPTVKVSGTVTGRAVSSIWVVTPNEKEIFDGSIKIGSNVQDYIVPGHGRKIVGADFTGQESWLATLLTDAIAGKIASNPWCRAVLYGDKDNKTDIHNITASTLNIGRGPSKGIGFSLQYGAGATKIIVGLQLAGLSRADAEATAEKYISFMKGPEGIARSTFGTLKELSQLSGIRTAILGCHVPESLDAKYCQRDFVTTRQNWLIQAAGADCLHALLTILTAFLDEYEVDAILSLHRHDAVYYSVAEGHEELFTRCLQQAHYLTKQLAYEQACLQAGQISSRLGATKYAKVTTLECPDSQKWFNEVKVAPCVGACEWDKDHLKPHQAVQMHPDWAFEYKPDTHLYQAHLKANRLSSTRQNSDIMSVVQDIRNFREVPLCA